MFDEVLDAYRSGDQNLFEARVRNWMDTNPENPFAQDTPEHNLFFKARLGHKRWRSGAISGRAGRREMIQYIAEIAKIYSEKPAKEEPPVEENENVIPEPTVKVKLDVSERVLGVLPKTASKKKVKKNDHSATD